MLKIRNIWASTASLSFLIFISLPCHAQNLPSNEATIPRFEKQGPRPSRVINDRLGKMSVFKDFSVNNFFDGEVVDLSAEEAKKGDAPAKVEVAKKEVAQASPTPSAPQPETTPANTASNPLGVPLKKPGPVFVGNFKPEDMLPPDQTPRVRINPEAPAPAIGMVMAYQEGDLDTANKYADSLVRYEQQMIFEVRELTEMIGQALVRQHAIQEQDWDGVQQYIAYQTAKQEEESGTGEIFHATHENSLARIKSDPRGKADIYFFFDLSSAYCRFMTPDVERLWLTFKNDPSVRMTGLTIGNVPEWWIKEFREYTGATFPIHDGTQVAKSFHLKLLPAFVVLSPTTNKAYMKSGQSSFLRLYEFVRKVQGLPANISAQLQNLMNTPIGDDEMKRAKEGKFKIAKLSLSNTPGGALKAERVNGAPRVARKSDSMEKF